MSTLRELAEAATPGPWDTASPPMEWSVWSLDGRVCGRMLKDDAAYIAAVSPDVILALLDRIAELEGPK